MEFHEVANIFPMMTDAEFRELVQDVKENGLVMPIETYQGKIIDGRNRYKACLEAEVEPEFNEWNGKGSLISHVVSLNLNRRHLTSGQKAAIGTEVEELLAEEKNKQLQEVASKRERNTNGTFAPSTEKIPHLDKGESRQQAAQIVGTNPHYITDAKSVKAQSPTAFDLLKQGAINMGEAKAIAKLPEEQLKEIAQLPREELKHEADKARTAEYKRRMRKLGEEAPPSLRPQNKQVKPVNLELVESGQFNIIYCDPQNNGGLAGLQDMPISEWIAENAVLFLWCDVDELPKGIRTLTDWGFEYRSFISWDMGLYFKRDEWLKHQNRLLVIGERGSHKPVTPTAATQIFTDYARMENREEKPERFFEEIETMFPKQKYFTVFNIAPRKGWVMKKGGFIT